MMVMVLLATMTMMVKLSRRMVMMMKMSTMKLR